MKTDLFVKSFLASFILVSFMSCSKGVVVKEEEDLDPPVVKTGYLADSEGENYIDILFALKDLTDRIDSLAVRVNDPECPSLDKYFPLLQNKWTGSDWRLEIHRFTYNSVDAFGDPVVLSAKMYMVRQAGTGFHHPFHRSVIYCQSFVPYPDVGFFQIPYMMRALWGDVLVCPWYEGMGVDTGEDKYYNVSEIKLMGQQAVHCQLAALELMDRLGVKRARDFHTECYGTSNGAATAAAVARNLEMGDEQTRKAVRLTSTVMLEGAMSYAPVFRDMLDGGAKTQVFVYAGMTNSLFRSNPDVFPEGTRREDFFSDWLNSYRIDTPLGNMHPLDAMYCGINVPLFDPQWGTLSPDAQLVFNPSFFNEDGSVRYDNPLVKGIGIAALRNDLTVDWRPRTHVVIYHSKDDDMISFDTVRKQYLAISRNGTNPHVRMRKLSGMTHQQAVFFAMLYLSVNPNPAI